MPCEAISMQAVWYLIFELWNTNYLKVFLKREGEVAN